MSYTPTNWATGDVITAAKLNKIEQGVATAGGGGVTLIPIAYTDNSIVLNMPAGQILSALQTGIVIAAEVDEDFQSYELILSASQFDGTFDVYVLHEGAIVGFSASGADDTPKHAIS